MTSIFEADQAARSTMGPIDWLKVEPQDAARREQTAALLKQGVLHTGEDYLHAAYVFQHGSKPEDYLLAHTLAVIATKKGVIGGDWIAAATLDRYLISAGKPQIYGTQYTKPRGGTWSLDMYDRGLISDALRAELNVPTQAAQAKRVLEMNAADQTAKPTH